MFINFQTCSELAEFQGRKVVIDGRVPIPDSASKQPLEPAVEKRKKPKQAQALEGLEKRAPLRKLHPGHGIRMRAQKLQLAPHLHLTLKN
jgi:hypothetical protein